MDSTKDFNENCGLHADDPKQCETIELKEENQSSHVTLREKEAAVGDKNGLASRREAEPETLESVQKYANRIKSFLGWELIVDEQKIETESGDSISEAAGISNLQKEVNNSIGDTVNKVDSDSLEDGENEESITDPQQSEQVIEAKPDTGLQTDQPNEYHLVNTFPKPESGQTDNKEIISEIKDADESSNLLHNTPDVIIKELTSESHAPENKSESENNQSDCTSPEMDQNELPNLDKSRTVSEDSTTEVLLKESKASYIGLEKARVIDEEEMQQKIIPEPETNVSEDLLQDNLNSPSKPIISRTKVDESENKASDTCKNLKETDESDDSTHFYENVSMKNNIKKPYMEEIRRLSIDIVKDVIESARNSVHEIIVSKSVQEMIAENVNKNHNGGDAACVFNGSKNLETEKFEDKHMLTYSSTKEIPSLEKIYNELTESKHNMNLIQDIQERKESITDEETICGFSSFKPQWIQKYATPKIFVLLFSLIGVLNGTYYTYVVSILSTLEKRYAFRTKVSGTIMLADEITPLILGVIVGYIGGKTHRPRMIALGMLMQVVCCFISGLPFLIYGSSKQLLLLGVENGTNPEMCEHNTETCDLDDRPPTLTVVGLFILASLFRGFATLSFYVIGVSYMDDISKKKNTPVYFAVSLALRLLGPLFGFLMSSAFLKLYENPFDDPGYGPDDPRWIGAWWIGFFLQGVLLLIFTLPIALFPRRLPGKKKLEKVSTASKESWRDMVKGLVSALKRLGNNPIYIVLIINTTMKIFGHFGHAIMLPKYMENQFRLSAADASLFSGAASIFCMMISTVLGGFFIWKFRPRIKPLLGGLVISEIILCTGFLILMIPRCQPADMLHYGMDDRGLILNSVCNQNCDCSTKSFTPFCGPDGKTTYFSPCHAGCTQELKLVNSSQKTMAFGDCSCVSAADSTDPSSTMITKGFCPDETCWSKTLAYLIIFFILVTISNTLTVAHTMILLRSVHPSDKSVALGTLETFICLFGFIPFPITFGALVDSACLVWEESCGETGNCWFYDMEKYDYLLHGTAAFFCSLSTICLIAMYFLSSRVRDLYIEEDEEEYIDNIKLDTISGSVTKL